MEDASFGASSFIADNFNDEPNVFVKNDDHGHTWI